MRMVVASDMSLDMLRRACDGICWRSKQMVMSWWDYWPELVLFVVFGPALFVWFVLTFG